MDGARARKKGVGSNAEAPDGDAVATGGRTRAAASDREGLSLEVDDGRDIFGDAGLGRVDDGFAPRGDGPRADDEP
jgi:hypothetical protein